MPRFNVTVSCPIHDSFRVQQVGGMFDLPLLPTASEQFAVHLPTDRDDWQIGLIVGPSGSGKSTVARHVFGDKLYQPGISNDRMTNDENSNTRHSSFENSSFSPWPTDRAVIDAFGDLPVRNVVELFTAVGFGSPPSWVKPYHVLSCGERFRCDLARALSRAEGGRRKAEGPAFLPPSALHLPPSLVAFDEFTSVVDRTVAKVCSAAIAKGVRNGNLPCRFVAVTCHYDIAQWLEPDWVLDMATRELIVFSESHDKRRCLRRPNIELQIHRCRVAAWEMFKRHHYLSGCLPPSARCYLTTWNDTPVNFCATLPMIAKRNHRRFTRIVTLPDYQGLGIGMRAVAAIAELHRAAGHRISVTSSHPALIRHCSHSPQWKAVNVKRAGARRAKQQTFAHYQNAASRSVVSFEYVAP